MRWRRDYSQTPRRALLGHGARPALCLCVSRTLWSQGPAGHRDSRVSYSGGHFPLALGLGPALPSGRLQTCLQSPAQMSPGQQGQGHPGVYAVAGAYKRDTETAPQPCPRREPENLDFTKGDGGTLCHWPPPSGATLSPLVLPQHLPRTLS